MLGVSIIPPYDTYIPYEVYIAPGLVAMIQLFNGMQSSLSMVYDREMGSMKTLMISPLPRWFLLLCKLLAGVAVSVCRSISSSPSPGSGTSTPPPLGYVAVLPALILSGLMLGALGLVLSSFIKQLENFAGVMNFVIFPMFFASSALYPLWRVKESSLTLYWICQLNPFTHAAELIRFALYCQFNPWRRRSCWASRWCSWRWPSWLRSRPRPDRTTRGGGMMAMRTMLLAVALTGWTAAAMAAPPPTDPDWPCFQRLVPQLTPGTYWAGPPAPAEADWHKDKAVADVVAQAAPRSVSITDGVAALDAFAAGLPPDARAASLAETFAGLVDETNRQRDEVVERIKELVRRQRAVAAIVQQISESLSAIPPDATGEQAAQRDDIIQRRALVIRGFEDVQRTIRYACDVPVQLEARLGAYARALQAKL